MTAKKSEEDEAVSSDKGCAEITNSEESNQEPLIIVPDANTMGIDRNPKEAGFEKLGGNEDVMILEQTSEENASRTVVPAADDKSEGDISPQIKMGRYNQDLGVEPEKDKQKNGEKLMELNNPQKSMFNSESVRIMKEVDWKTNENCC